MITQNLNAVVIAIIISQCLTNNTPIQTYLQHRLILEMVLGIMGASNINYDLQHLVV